MRSTTQRRGRTAKPFLSSLGSDDLCVQQRRLCDRSVNLPAVVAAISPDQFEPRGAVADFSQDQAGSVAFLDRGGVDNDPHRQPFAIDQGIDFAALHLFVGVVTYLSVVTAPFYIRRDATNFWVKLLFAHLQQRTAPAGVVKSEQKDSGAERHVEGVERQRREQIVDAKDPGK